MTRKVKVGIMEKRLKNIYKKQLFLDLVKLGHDFHHSMRNRNNPKYQVYVMVDTPELRRDMVRLVGQSYVEEFNDVK
ncbi:MAG: hypothetical protein LRY73_01920 [Bacillus sp. (in: Bacteria)]|nr:hypothetical protein [Bacillus sp. (in: firmicutes)]